MKRMGIRVTVTVLAVIAVFAVGGAAIRYAYRACQKAVYPLKYEEIVSAYAEEYDLPPSLIYAVIHTESRFREDAESAAGAKGLMQLMDNTYEWIQTKLPGDPMPIDRIFEPEVNIRCGTKVLDVLFTMFSKKETAIAAYNAGNGTVSKWLKDPAYSADGKTLTHIPYEETANYVKRVLKTQERYQTLYGIE